MGSSWRNAIACQQAAVAVVQTLLAAPLVATSVWLLSYGTRRWTDESAWRRFPPDFGCDNGRLLDTCTASQLAWLLAPPAAAGLFCIALLYLRGAAERRKHNAEAAAAGSGGSGGSAKAPQSGAERRLGWLGRAAATQLPPARFWAWWCGGMSGGDAAVVVAWLGVNAIWLAAILKRYYSLADLLARLGHTPRWAIETELTAIGFGALLFPNLLLLFYPVSRGSVLLQASGLGYPAAIRYHRWLGHWVMVLVTAHSLGFWVVWALLGQWKKEALDFGDRVNNLMGGLSFLSGLALWVTSLDNARRSAYWLFYPMHHIGFWGFMLAGLMHYPQMLWYFIPGLLFYAIDGAYRLTQALGRRAVVLEAAAPGGEQASVASLLLACPPYAVAPSGYVWIQAPSISHSQWHPFEYTAEAAIWGKRGATGGAVEGGQAAMLVHVKAYDRWTSQFVAAVAACGRGIVLRIEGPYPDTPVWTGRAGDEAVVIVAGGIGVAAALGVLEELPPGPSSPPVLLIWSARHPSELLLIAPRLFSTIRNRRLAVTTRIHYTGAESDLRTASEAAESAAAAAAAAESAGDGSSAPGTPSSVSSGDGLLGGGNGGIDSGNGSSAAATSALKTLPGGLLAAAAANSAARGSGGAAHGSVHGDSGGVSPLCPVMALGGSLGAQAAHRAAFHILACAGAVAALLLVRGASLVWPPAPWTAAATGSAYTIGIALGATLPAALILSLQAFFSSSRPRRGGSAAAGASPGAAAVQPFAQPLLSVRTRGRTAHAASVVPTARVVAGARGGLALEIPSSEAPAAAAAAAATAAAAVPTNGNGVTLGSGSSNALIPLHPGRPDLARTLAGWLAGLKQLPSPGDVTTAGDAGDAAATGDSKRSCAWGCGAAPLQVGVFAMGPSALLSQAQLLCADTNSGRSPVRAAAGAARPVFLRYVQKTHSL